MAKSLTLSLNRFAKWRWSTLAKVVRDLLRVREAVKLALGSMSSSNELGSRDEDLARDFWSIANSELFWVRAEGLSSVVKPMRSMQGWLRGCSCHESEYLANDNVKCPWKGCRAPELANRIADLYHEVAKVPQKWTANEVKLDMFGDTVNALLSMLHLKFAWVNEPPYLIWSVKDAGSAANFLRARDEEVKRGQPPHRVTEHFAGLGQHSLRGDMEAYASGQKPSSRLMHELQAYSLCVLDDTWP